MVLAEVTEYFSGQGQVSFSDRDAVTGLATGGYTFLGDCSTLELKVSVERKEHMEHQTGKNSVDAVFESAQKCEFNGTFGGFDGKNLDLYLYGNSAIQATASVTGETVVIPPKGKRVPLARMPVANTVPTITGGGTAGTDHILDLSTGMILIPATSTLTSGNNLTVNYSAAAERVTTAFTSENKYRIIRFDGLNRAADNKPVVVEVYKARFDPAEMIGLIIDEFAEYTLNGTALYDPLYAASALYGGFFRIRVKQ
jgi:hypothetical protein